MGIELCVDMSATPFYLHGSGYPEGSPFPWIVSDFFVGRRDRKRDNENPRGCRAIDRTLDGQTPALHFTFETHHLRSAGGREIDRR